MTTDPRIDPRVIEAAAYARYCAFLDGYPGLERKGAPWKRTVECMWFINEHGASWRDSWAIGRVRTLIREAEVSVTAAFRAAREAGATHIDVRDGRQWLVQAHLTIESKDECEGGIHGLCLAPLDGGDDVTRAKPGAVGHVPRDGGDDD